MRDATCFKIGLQAVTVQAVDFLVNHYKTSLRGGHCSCPLLGTRSQMAIDKSVTLRIKKATTGNFNNAIVKFNR